MPDAPTGSRSDAARLTSARVDDLGGVLTTVVVGNASSSAFRITVDKETGRVCVGGLEFSSGANAVSALAAKLAAMEKAR